MIHLPIFYRFTHLQWGNDNRMASGEILKGKNGGKPHRTRSVYHSLTLALLANYMYITYMKKHEGRSYIYCNRWVYDCPILFEISQSVYISHVSLSSADFVYIYRASTSSSLCQQMPWQLVISIAQCTGDFRCYVGCNLNCYIVNICMGLWREWGKTKSF